MASPVGLPKGKKGFVFSNWAKIYSSKPELYFQPSSIEEVVALVNAARKENKTLVTVGSGHSPSDLCMTNEWLVNLDKLNRVISMTEHKDKLYADVTVEAGLRIYQFNEYLGKHGYTIQNLGSISEQSVAGIISTGTHGSSPYHGLVSSQYVNLTIVNGKGELVFLDSENQPEVFRAALLSLGQIGIIVRATVRVVPAFKIKSTQEVIRFETLLEEWDNIWASSEFIRCWWYPYSRKCILWRGRRSEETDVIRRGSWWGSFLGRHFYEALLWIAVNIRPSLTPAVERFVFRKQYGSIQNYGKGDVAVQNSIDALNMDCLFSQFVDEWGCPMVNGIDLLRTLDRSIAQAAKTNEFYVHVPVEVRCSNTTLPDQPIDYSDRTKNSKGAVFGNTLRPYLDSTPHLKYKPLEEVTEKQLTLYVNATMYRPFGTNTPIKKWYDVFEQAMSDAGGKPHWAKNFIGSTAFAAGQTKSENEYVDYEMRGMATKFKEWYGDDLIKFQEVRKIQDPEGVFLANKAWAIRNGILDIDG
ncbi:LAMI_0G15192g1_1 [Lachancea mirantina]|uniref:D-arabinono-1,4-lactone oxidase n=1 Tax=Lachancea mirantina TaxID=1230905 RepID=A0A1G4KCC7_9SACH|nr:LAMI_0G15192g1_1 [Lachancea mirantina]